MERLIEDLKIVLERGLDLNISQLSINNGTELIECSKYLPKSFVPRQEWRTFHPEEIDILTCLPARWDLGKYIGVIQLPESLIQPLRDILDRSEFDPLDPDRYINKISFNPDYQSIVEKIATHLQYYCIGTDKIKSLGIHLNRSGLITTTVDAIEFLPNKPHVGLHLDSWEKAPLRRRHLSSNRICINLGHEPRYFLFINLSLMKMFELLGLSTAVDISHYYRGNELPDKFMKTYPDYPVIKLALAPNQAYIAPTENIIHDASTLDKKELDLSLTFIGKFGINTGNR
jgi:hypothetical protein